MQITWHGQYTLKIVSKDITVVFDPYAPDTGLTPFRAKADIVVLSNPSDESMSHLDAISGTPRIIDTPGEYSVGDLTLHAMSWHAEDGSERSLQRWVIEDMTVLYVGALERELTDDELRELERTGVDVLILPVGGASALDTKKAVHMVTTIEPRVVIPIHHKIPKLKEELESVQMFAKEMGLGSQTAEKKVTLKANKLPQEDIEVVILEP